MSVCTGEPIVPVVWVVKRDRWLLRPCEILNLPSGEVPDIPQLLLARPGYVALKREDKSATFYDASDFPLAHSVAVARVADFLKERPRHGPARHARGPLRDLDDERRARPQCQPKGPGHEHYEGKLREEEQGVLL